MRVIAGKARRLCLKTPPGFDTRPTTDRIKETLFNIIQPDIPGSYFLDLFSGSGGIGIEALSRDAKFCVFVDNSIKAAACIRENLEHTRLSGDALVISKNVLSAISELKLKGFSFDFVYMDPPYNSNLEEETLAALSESGIINNDTTVIVEADKYNNLDFLKESAFEITKEKIYKTNKHYFLKLKGVQI